MKTFWTTIIVLIIIGAGFFVYKNEFSPAENPSGQTSENQNEGSSSPIRNLSYHTETISAPGLPLGSFGLTIPDGYHISVAANGMTKPRFMALSPDGRLFVPDMINAGDTDNGKIYILSGFNSETHTFGLKSVYLSNLRNPNSVTFYKDTSGKEWIYIALTDKLIRYPYHAGDMQPLGDPQTIATFPDFGNPASEGGWHLTRTLAIHDDKIYVSVGSSCDGCEEMNFKRASILLMDPDGKNLKVYANGLRNAVGLDFVGDSLYATDMGVDHLGNGAPNDVVLKIQAGANYGWPYCYYLNGKVLPDTTENWKNSFDCSVVPAAFTDLPPHSAPLGIEFVDSKAGSVLQNSFLVALHGSGNVSIGTGNAVVRVSKDGATVTPIVSGFLKDGKRAGRAAGILENSNGDIFITDDYDGLVYDLYKASE
ncbi:MAG TPA: PQQ-dependent sugar dehydrogenase [Candidatus Paceibacterota bacterium]|nr:PQQ-dependent sugar dehydrogenase [Candidatus Paceibacterota bacterium]